MNGEGEAEVSNINKRIPSHLLLRLLLISIGIVLLEWSDKAKCFWSQRFLNRLEIPFVLVKGPLTEQPPPTGPPPPPSSSLSHLIARHALNLSASWCRAPLKKEAGVKKLPMSPSQHCTDLMLPNTVSILEFIQKVEKGHKYLNFREYSWVWAYTSVTARCKMLLRHRRVQPLMNLMYDGLWAEPTVILTVTSKIRQKLVSSKDSCYNQVTCGSDATITWHTSELPQGALSSTRSSQN